MRSPLCSALLLPLALLLGCGVSTPSNPGDGSTANNAYFSGDWLVLQPRAVNLSPTPVFGFTGALQFNGTSVTGTVRAYALTLPPCVSYAQDLTVTGTYTAAGILTLNIPVAGGTATISATVVQPQTYNPATLQIVGGSCAMPSSPVQLAQFVPISGTYFGTMSALSTTGTPITGSTITVSANLTQSPTPNADGQFPLTGTVTATGNCTVTFPLTGYIVTGGIVEPPPVPFPTLAFLGGIIPSGRLLIGDLFPSSCPYSHYFGTLTQQ
jgi:hypothetical protein